MRAAPKLTRIAAPAGFGKTTLVSAWVAGCARPVATAARPGIALHYSRQLLAALGQSPAGPPAKQALTEPLSDRELEVLRLLGSDLSGPEIARELMVSRNTHTKNHLRQARS